MKWQKISKQSCEKDIGLGYGLKFASSDIPSQIIWHNLNKSSKLVEDLQNVIPNFAYVLTAITNVWFLEGRLATKLRLYPNLTSFYDFVIS